MADLRLYDVTMPNGTTTQMQLNNEDAKLYGDAAKLAAEPTATPLAPDEYDAKARAPQNKSAAPETK